MKDFSLFLKQHYLKNLRKIEKVKSPKVARTKNRRVMVLSKCAVCDSKKSKNNKQQEASELLSSLGIKRPLSKIPLVGRSSFVLEVLASQYKI